MLTKQLQHALSCGGHIAYRVTPPQVQQKVDVIFLHGLLSDMRGTKSRQLEEHAQQQGHGFLCYDARGHGSSSGTLQDTAMAEWYEDACTALQLAPAERHILVGSSFGGWQALHLALEHPDKVAGLVLIAPALDFTARIWASLSPEQQAAAEQQDRLSIGSSYVEGGQIHVRMKFIRDAQRFLVLTNRLRELQLRCPVHILHGMQDDTVPTDVSQRLLHELPADQVLLTLVKDGNHRLSRPQDLQLMLAAVEGMLQRTAAG